MDLQRRITRHGGSGYHASRSHRVQRQRGYLLTLLMAATAGAEVAAAASMELPPLVQPASTEHHVGKVVWADLVTPDLDAAKRFYGGVFGWTFSDTANAQDGYAVAYLGGRPVAGLLQRATPAREHGHPVWLSFLAVRDVDATSRTALSHGARVVFASTSYPGRGRQAVLRDPAGALFGILASSSGDPATDADFYRAVIGLPRRSYARGSCPTGREPRQAQCAVHSEPPARSLSEPRVPEEPRYASAQTVRVIAPSIYILALPRMLS